MLEAVTRREFESIWENKIKQTFKRQWDSSGDLEAWKHHKIFVFELELDKLRQVLKDSHIYLYRNKEKRFKLLS